MQLISIKNTLHTPRIIIYCIRQKKSKNIYYLQRFISFINIWYQIVFSNLLDMNLFKLDILIERIKP